jgi:predicted RNase H-like HicB family nuclease
MTRHYIAVIHKDQDSCFGVHFPDLRGIYTAGDTLDEAVEEARELLSFAAESWEEDTGTAFPEPRSIDALRADPSFLEDAENGILVAVPFEPAPRRLAAE